MRLPLSLSLHPSLLGPLTFCCREWQLHSLGHGGPPSDVVAWGHGSVLAKEVLQAADLHPHKEE